MNHFNDNIYFKYNIIICLEINILNIYNNLYYIKFNITYLLQFIYIIEILYINYQILHNKYI